VFLKVGGISLAGFGRLLTAFLHSSPDDLKQIPIKPSAQSIGVLIHVPTVEIKGGNVLG
jgi:hypothetical protein